MTATTRAVHILVEGRVQNVGYRVFVAREAGRLQLHGFVRNHSDGSVETFVEGPSQKIDEFLALATKGPKTAEIRAIRIEDAGADALAEFTALVEDQGAEGFFAAPAK